MIDASSLCTLVQMLLAINAFRSLHLRVLLGKLRQLMKKQVAFFRRNSMRFSESTALRMVKCLRAMLTSLSLGGLSFDAYRTRRFQRNVAESEVDTDTVACIVDVIGTMNCVRQLVLSGVQSTTPPDLTASKIESDFNEQFLQDAVFKKKDDVIAALRSASLYAPERLAAVVTASSALRALFARSGARGVAEICSDRPTRKHRGNLRPAVAF